MSITFTPCIVDNKLSSRPVFTESERKHGTWTEGGDVGADYKANEQYVEHSEKTFNNTSAIEFMALLGYGRANIYVVEIREMMGKCLYRLDNTNPNIKEYNSIKARINEIVAMCKLGMTRNATHIVAA